MNTTTTVKFSSGEVCRIAGLHQNTLDRWVKLGWVSPVSGGTRRGDHRTYSLVQAVGVTAGARWRSERAQPDRVAGIVRYISGLDITHLEAELASGRTFPIPAAMLGVSWLPGMMIEPPATAGMGIHTELLIQRLDLKKIYEEVRREAAKIQTSLK